MSIIIGIIVFAAAIFLAVKLWAIHWLLGAAVALVGGWLAARIAFG